MKLSMFILQRWFRNHGYKTHSAISNGPACLVGARISDDISQKSIACILTKDDQCGLVSIVNRSDILFITNASGEDVLNTANEAFEYYNAWEVYLLRSAFQKASLQELLDIANLAIMRPMLIKNSRQELCAITESYGEHVHPMWAEYLKRADHLPARFFDPSHSYNEPTDVAVQREPQIGFSPTYGGNFLYANLWTNNRRVGHICAYEHNLVFDRSDLQVMAVFQNIINFYVTASPGVLFSLSAMEEYIASVLTGDTTPNVLPEDLYKACDWNEEDQLLLFAFQPRSTSIPHGILADIRSELDQIVYPMYEVQVKEYNVFLVNMTRFQCEKSLSQILQEVPGTEHMTWGISNRFTGVTHLKEHFHALRLVIDWANMHHLPGAQVQDVFPALAVRQLDGLEAIDAYLSPACSLLQKYDQENCTHYAESLFWYLFYNRNLMMVSTRMGAHRNTVNKWILKIFELLGEDPFEKFAPRMTYLLTYLRSNPDLL